MGRSKSLLFAVGGSGGHLFPALGLATLLKQRDPGISIFFAGGGLKNQKFFDNQPYVYHYLPSATLSLQRPIKGVKSLLAIGSGFLKSCSLIDSSKPDLIIGFGSHYSLPLLMAGVWRRIPFVLHEQNTVPGRVVRMFSRKAAFTGIHFAETKARLKGKCLHVGMPLRADFIKGKVSQGEARQYYSLKSDKPAILVFGGSQGAEGINRMVVEALNKVSPDVQIIHFTGSAAEAGRLKGFYDSKGITSSVKAFEERMEFAWAAADCVVSRSGAASLAEQIAYEVPGILIPYPFSMDNHQDVNADHFVREVKGGVKVSENQSDGDELAAALKRMLDPCHLSLYKQNIAAYRKEVKTLDFAEEILKLINF